MVEIAAREYYSRNFTLLQKDLRLHYFWTVKCTLMGTMSAVLCMIEASHGKIASLKVTIMS
jgi:hypothetical protein